MANATVVSNAIVPEVLNQHNYKDWSSRVKTYLLAEDLWDMVETEPPGSEEKDWEKKNAKALHTIKISCGPELYTFIRESSTAKIAWEVLEKQFISRKILRLLKKEREDKKTSCHPDEVEIKGCTEGNENKANYDFDSIYNSFFDYVCNGDWENAQECITELNPHDAVRARDPRNGSTALHLAARKGHLHIVKELLVLMTPEDLKTTDKYGYTALHIAVLNGHVDIVKEVVLLMSQEALENKDNAGYTALGCAFHVDRNHKEEDVIEMAKYMVEKNRRILGIALPAHHYIPVVEASSSIDKWKVARYLYSVTPVEYLIPPENGSQGATLICCCIKTNELDIALDLLKKCPSLAIVKTVSGREFPILVLVRMHSTFLRGLQLNFWKKWIYNGIRIQAHTSFNIHEISIDIFKSEYDEGNQRDLVITDSKLFRRLAEGLLQLFGVLNRIYEMKSTHGQIFELISCMGEETRNNMNSFTVEQLNMVNAALFEAIEQGNIEFVTHVCKENSRLIDTFDEKRRSIFHFAIECRQEEIYSLIYGLEKQKMDEFGLQLANFRNSMLHSAANLSPVSKFNQIQGAYLQMQRELQWFQEVENVVPLAMHDSRNSSDDLTARELFFKNHKKLMEDAEISMKGIAASSTVVGALIVTIMFAAAFTIPGGNNGSTGLPMFLEENLFLVFIVSDTISLVSSTTSVIIFLGILTSRYAQDDYLKNLPTKMLIGLFTLFIAIATMMTAFCCGLVIMLHGKYSWVAIPSILVASIPVTSFVWMLFPLLLQTFISTYGPGIFNRKVKQWY